MQIVLSNDAVKQYNHLPPGDKKKIKKKLNTLNENPYAGKKLSGELFLYRSLRVWPYRIIYIINKNEEMIEVSSIVHRQGAYK
ncbi:MAG: Addiction module toxin, RelE/StbE family [Candidatus Gottesmanbacteria bacterium GW2011_GWC2_39_8]|uniref:Addiction module toxin, RelE/StbE family n=1 Tax=Candidatus Gottesmanbacteria bacterium GW2011_GWC2_39_8 TaxID=1618450 RepID=A0A0G0PX27_9BACT|nr:MAG: Addiction module toxin, RelE/StbE family [Candidatus Gottesmanbacteria bacterium GW2011_GWC2_39_8]